MKQTFLTLDAMIEILEDQRQRVLSATRIPKGEESERQYEHRARSHIEIKLRFLAMCEAKLEEVSRRGRLH